jgi:hypothetical protein
MIHLLLGRGIIQWHQSSTEGEAEEEKRGRRFEEKTDLPFQGQEKEEEEFLTVGDWSDFHR